LKGAVTASTQQAADAGLLALQGGGNAVDAIVAAALATCVADPCNTGIGGYGGYMVVQRAGEPASCIAFPVSPPASLQGAWPGEPCPESGPRCSTVPNVVAGLGTALQRFGSRSWAAVCASAVRLAEDGVVANPTTARAFELHRADPFVAACFQFDEVAEGRQYRLRFRQPRLAATLATLAKEGPEWFYAGPLADAAAKAFESAGCSVDVADWRQQIGGVFLEAAATWTIEDARFSSAPLGLSGSASTFAFLEAAARIAKRTPLDAPDGVASFAEAIASVWEHRRSAAGGYDFGRTSLRNWIDAALSRGSAPMTDSAASEHTAHLNAVDRTGTVAALTFTHGPRWFGGRWSIPDTGVLMNAGMLNCTPSTVVRRGPRWYGVSNMSPTIAERGSLRVAIGCPGARRIPSNIAIALARLLYGRGGLQASVSGGRFHSEGRECAYAEIARFSADAIAALSARFATVRAESDDNYYGPLTAVAVDQHGRLEAAVDDRAFRGFSALA
jgi:gamma-glutamyltranspeptidase / glutathione hydrolase